MAIILWALLLLISLIFGFISVLGLFGVGILSLVNKSGNMDWLKKYPITKGLVVATIASFVLFITSISGILFSENTYEIAANEEKIDAIVLNEFVSENYLANRVSQVEEAKLVKQEKIEQEKVAKAEKEKQALAAAKKKEAQEKAAKAKAAKEKQENETQEKRKNAAEKKKKQQAAKKRSTMHVHFIDVGQADAALIQYNDRAILIDSGNWNGNQTVNYLQHLGIQKLDLVVGSHPHADHIGQLDKVIDNFAVDEVWMSGGTATSNVFARVIEAIDSKGIGYDEPRAGDHYQIGDLVIDILSPTGLTGNLNDDSIVMKLTYGGISFLFTGDAESPAESRMVSSGQKLDSTILKVAHHGSDTSSTEAFIQAVNPKTAIISVGENSQYNHPNKSVLNRLNNNNIDSYATNAHGTIIVTTDGSTYNVSTEKEGTIKPGSKSKKQTKKSSTNKTTENPKQQTNKQSEAKNNGNCVDINTASEIELQNIKHIGEKRAPDVIANRPYNSVDELTRIKGIADARIADIKQEGIACVN